jgi:hypothetical protein
MRVLMAESTPEKGALIGAGAGALMGQAIGRDTEAIPSEANQQTNCHKVTKRTWKDGELIKETIEEVCEGEKQSGEY